MVCFLHKNKGSCQGVYHEWFFDMEKQTCSPFVHSGCLGNGNRFLTKMDCQDMCTLQDEIELCFKPVMEGACEESHPRWYFDADHSECLPCRLSDSTKITHFFLKKIVKTFSIR